MSMLTHEVCEALVKCCPSDSELELVKPAHAAPRETLGTVEIFFLQMQLVPRCSPHTLFSSKSEIRMID